MKSSVKHRFSKLEKYVVWSTYNGICYWCGEPVSLKSCSIDHIIPEMEISNLDRIIYEYQLPKDFNINDFENWVPAHNNCNSKKGFRLYPASPVFLGILGEVIKKSESAKKISDKLSSIQNVEKELGKLNSLVESGLISGREIVEHLGYKIVKEERNLKLNLKIPEGWKVDQVDSLRNIAYVSNGRVIGRTVINPRNDFDPWWYCGNCGYHGPWNGTKCLTCGYHNDPYD